MTNLNPPVTARGKDPIPLTVTDPARVVRLLSAGWSLAEGETFDPNTAVAKKPRELNAPDVIGLKTTSDDTSDVTLADIPDDDEDDSDDEDSDDDGDPASTTPAQTPPAAAGGHLPGLSGKSRDALVAIAESEGVAFRADITKPDLKRAIEAHRLSK